MMPAYIVITCCSPKAAIRPGGNTSSTGCVPRPARASSVLTSDISLVLSPRTSTRLGALEDYVLGALPEGHLSQGAQVLLALHDGQEVVAGELAQLAREDRAGVGEEDLRL